MTKGNLVQNGSVEGFFAWIVERQNIYNKRAAGEAPPWTDDKIMQKYFFTNVFREQDKVTVWIDKNWRRDTDNPGNIIFAMAVARFFNYIPTLEYIGYTHDWEVTKRRLAELDEGNVKGEGNYARKIFSEAYLIAGTDLKGKSKVRGVIDRLDFIWRDRAKLSKLITGTTLEGAWKVLLQYPGIGPFIAYEIVTDLRHTKILKDAPDIMTWANPGPGAKRGLQRIYPHVGNTVHQILLMRELLNESGMYVEDALEMRDIEHSLCEMDKYLRIKQAVEGGIPVSGMRLHRQSSQKEQSCEVPRSDTTRPSKKFPSRASTSGSVAKKTKKN